MGRVNNECSCYLQIAKLFWISGVKLGSKRICIGIAFFASQNAHDQFRIVVQYLLHRWGRTLSRNQCREAHSPLGRWVTGAPDPPPTSLQIIIMIIMICLVCQEVGGDRRPHRPQQLKTGLRIEIHVSNDSVGRLPPFLRRKTIWTSRHR